MIHSPNAAPLLVSTFIFFAKLSFNFNYNLVESWDSINFIFNTHPPTHPTTHPQEKFKNPHLLNLT